MLCVVVFRAKNGELLSDFKGFAGVYLNVNRETREESWSLDRSSAEPIPIAQLSNPVPGKLKARGYFSRH